MKDTVRLLLLGILAAHAAGAEEPAREHRAEGVWYGADFDDSPCTRTDGGLIREAVSRLPSCSASPVLYVLEVSVRGEEAIGTLTSGLRPVMGSPAAMRRLLSGTRIELPDGLAMHGEVAGDQLYLATADEVPVVVEATVRSNKMSATVSADADVNPRKIRFERCVPKSKQNDCSVNALWRRLAEENPPRLVSPTRISMGPLPASITNTQQGPCCNDPSLESNGIR